MSFEKENISTLLIQYNAVRLGMKLMQYRNPLNYYETIYPLPEGCEIIEPSSGENADIIHLFFDNYDDLIITLPLYIKLLNRKGIVWISWPKSMPESEIEKIYKFCRKLKLKEQNQTINFFDYIGSEFIPTIKRK